MRAWAEPHRASRSMVKIAAFLLLLMMLAPSSAEARLSSGLYCQHDLKDVQTFGFKRVGSGRIVFGFSDWFPSKNNITIYGRANWKNGRWVFERGIDSPNPDERCRAYIKISPRGRVEIEGDARALCRSQGGAGTFVRHSVFAPRTYQKRVSTELDSTSDFFEYGDC